jgi:outer membrane murein-binding lipoprotein Lpp
MKTMQLVNLSAVIAAVGFLYGCSGNPPTEQMSVAEHVISDADINKASEYSPLEMQIAREKYDEAKQAITDEDYEKARRLAEQVTVDVQAANAKADALRSKKAIDELRETTKTLHEEVDSKSAN